MTEEGLRRQPTPHVLVLGACTECTPEEHCGNDTCDLAWSIECPGLERGSCRAYWECVQCRDPEGDLLEQLEQDGMAHGVEHTWLGHCGWSTAGTECWVQVADYTCDAVRDLVDEHSLKAGRHEVHFESDEDYPVLSLATVPA